MYDVPFYPCRARPSPHELSQDPKSNMFLTSGHEAQEGGEGGEEKEAEKTGDEDGGNMAGDIDLDDQVHFHFSIFVFSPERL